MGHARGRPWRLRHRPVHRRRSIADDEQAWLARVPAADTTDRARLNTWFLSDTGLQHLGNLLRTGHYAIDVPEHGALLVVAWLVENGHDALALDLVSELYPLLDRLRFYPGEAERAPTSGAVVHLRTAGEVADQLRRIDVPEQVAAMNEALLTWLPLYDRLVALWLETVEDDWPCRRWPANWAERRATWLGDYDVALASARLCKEYQKPRSTFAILRDALERCVVGRAGFVRAREFSHQAARVGVTTHPQAGRRGCRGSRGSGTR